MSTTLVMCSGGMDSTASALKLIDAQTADKLHLHHIRMIDGTNRYQPQWQGFCALVRYMDEFFPDFFTWSASTIDVSFLKTTPLDVYFVGNMASQIVLSQEELGLYRIVYIASGFKTDVRSARKHFPDETLSDDECMKLRTEKVQEYFKLPLKRTRLGIFTPPVILPVQKNTRKAIVRQLPRALDTLFWSCYNPIDKTDRWEPCGKCLTCREFAEEKITHPSMIKDPVLASYLEV